MALTASRARQAMLEKTLLFSRSICEFCIVDFDVYTAPREGGISLSVILPYSPVRVGNCAISRFINSSKSGSFRANTVFVPSSVTVGVMSAWQLTW